MAKKTSKKDLRNYLDFIPVHHEQYSYTVSDKGAVTVYVENKGAFNKIAQVVFKKPFPRFIGMKWEILSGR